MRARDLLEIFVDFLFRSLVMLVCIILCNKLFTVNHNIKGIYIYERKRREIVLYTIPAVCNVFSLIPSTHLDF